MQEQQDILSGESPVDEVAVRTAEAAVQTTSDATCIPGIKGRTAANLDLCSCQGTRDGGQDGSWQAQSMARREGSRAAALTAADLGAESAAGQDSVSCSGCELLNHHVARLREQLATADDTREVLNFFIFAVGHS